MTSEPVYEKPDGWYFTLYGKEFGPCETEDDAWTYYEYILNSGQCPTCGD